MEDNVIIMLPSGTQKLIQIKGQPVNLGKFGSFNTNDLIGHFYSVPLEIYDIDKIKPLEQINYLEAYNIDPKLETENNNQEILDNGTKQKLSQKDVEALKKKSLGGELNHQVHYFYNI